MEKMVISGSLDDVKLGSKIVFEVEEEGVLKQFCGLENFVRIGKIVIVDNHHEVVQFWPRGLSVVHIDQHSDMRPYDGTLEVGNFLTYALQEGLIVGVEQVRTEYSLMHFEVPYEKFILDIDLDFWDPQMSIENYQGTLDKVKDLISRAEIVTIATSPYFLDQELAIKILHDLLG